MHTGFNASRPLEGRTILQIIPDLEAGGAERTTVDIAEGLVQAGARALVASTGGRLVGELSAKGGMFIPFPARTKNPFAMASNIGKLVRLMRDEQVDLIHARSRAPAWVALAAARYLKRPFVTTYHGAYRGQSAAKKLYNSVMVRSDRVIANSVFTAKSIRETFGTPPERLRIIPRGTDLAAFAQGKVHPGQVDALRQAWQVAPESRLVLLPGRLTAWKGQRVLVEAAALLEAHGLRDVTYILAGDSQGRDGYRESLQNQIERHGLLQRVRIVGHVTTMAAAYATATCVVVPSILPEAFGRVAVEAQAAGVPVIVSDLGAVSETVLAPPDLAPEFRTGWRVPAGDAHALAQTLLEVLSLGASAREKLAARADRHVTRHFSLESMVQSTLGVYAELLET